MLTVYGRATSSNVQAVMWTIGELGLDYERLDLGHSFGGLDTPEFLAMNPNGKIPVLRDGDGPALFESAAIVRYLAARYGDEHFWPHDPYARAEVDMWADWIKTSFGPHLQMNIFWPLMSKELTPEQGAALETSVSTMTDLAEIANKAISGRDYLGGDRPCFADMIFGSLLYRYHTLDFKKRALPAFDAYYDRLCDRPAYREHVMVSYEVLRAK